MENVKETLKTILDGVNGLVDTKKVIGEPFTIGDTTVIPFIESSIGMGVGEFSNNADKSAGGMAMKVSPIACLVIQNGFTKLINIQNQDPITKALDMIPDLVDKLTVRKHQLSEEVEDAIDDLDTEFYNIESEE